MNSAAVKIVVENHTRFRTNISEQITLRRANYTPIDNGMWEDESVSYQARCLFAYLSRLPPDVHPSRKTLATKTKQGEHKIGKLIKELESAGWIRRHSMVINGARGERIDLLGSEAWPITKSIPDKIDPPQSQFHPESTEPEVDSIQNQPEHSNPCPSRGTTPLIKYMENLNIKNGWNTNMNVISDIGRIGSPGKGLRIVRPEPAIKVTSDLVEVCKSIEQALRRRGEFIKYDLTHKVIGELVGLHGREEIEAWITWLDQNQIRMSRISSWEERLRSAWKAYEERDAVIDRPIVSAVNEQCSEEEHRRWLASIACEPAMPY